MVGVLVGVAAVVAVVTLIGVVTVLGRSYSCCSYSSWRARATH